jgi:hypothetical protein
LLTTGSSCSSTALRSTSRTTPPTACAQIGETVAFDNAIGVALEYQRSHPDTLIVVTADHAHTSQIVAEDSNGAGAPTGWSDNLITKDGQTFRLTYGSVGGTTPPASPAALSQQHTGSVVPIWGGGPGGAEILGPPITPTCSTCSGPATGTTVGRHPCRAAALCRRPSRRRQLTCGADACVVDLNEAIEHVVRG